MSHSPHKDQMVNQALLILWMAMMVSNLIVVGVSYFIFFPHEPTGEPASFFLPVLTIISLGVGYVSHLIFERVNSIKQNSELSALIKSQRSFSYYILSWALGESITIFGMVYSMLAIGEMKGVAYGFFLAGIYLHILHRPRS